MDINNARVYFNRGASYQALKNFNQAIDDFRKAINIDNDFFEAKGGLGLLELRLKKFNTGWENVLNQDKNENHNIRWLRQWDCNCPDH